MIFIKNNYEIVGDVVNIELNRRIGENLFTTIDKNDFKRANENPFTWFAYYSKFTDSFYAASNFVLDSGKRTIIYLHRWIMEPPEDMFVDHFDHDTLNNKRSNLRNLTVSENSLHRLGKPNKNNSTGVKGVYLQSGKYAVMVRENKKTITLGRFEYLEEAKKLSDEYYSKINN